MKRFCIIGCVLLISLSSLFAANSLNLQKELDFFFSLEQETPTDDFLKVIAPCERDYSYISSFRYKYTFKKNGSNFFDSYYCIVGAKTGFSGCFGFVKNSSSTNKCIEDFNTIKVACNSFFGDGEDLSNEDEMKYTWTNSDYSKITLTAEKKGSTKYVCTLDYRTFIAQMIERMSFSLLFGIPNYEVDVPEINKSNLINGETGSMYTDFSAGGDELIDCRFLPFTVFYNYGRLFYAFSNTETLDAEIALNMLYQIALEIYSRFGGNSFEISPSAGAYMFDNESVSSVMNRVMKDDPCYVLVENVKVDTFTGTIFVQLHPITKNQARLKVSIYSTDYYNSILESAK